MVSNPSTLDTSAASHFIASQHGLVRRQRLTEFWCLVAKKCLNPNELLRVRFNHKTDKHQP